jgi:uncharacterized small protein (DUF1192 family)
MVAPLATVHNGPSGGIEFRLWNEQRTGYRVVGKYAVLQLLSKDERDRLARMEAERKDTRDSKRAADAFWRDVMRGG